MVQIIAIEWCKKRPDQTSVAPDSSQKFPSRVSKNLKKSMKTLHFEENQQNN
jgi:hypothetical protein